MPSRGHIQTPLDPLDGQKSLEEVKDEIYQRLTTRKIQELQQQLIRDLMDKYNIVIHQDAILKKAEDEATEDKDQDTK